MQMPMWFGVLASLFLVSADGKSDRDKLQGEWQVESGMMNGEKADEDFVKSFTLTFTGDKWAVKIGEQEDKGTFKEDGAKKPKEITFTSESGEERPGVYDFDGEKLKICVSGPGGTRPTELDSKKDSGTMFLVFKKKK